MFTFQERASQDEIATEEGTPLTKDEVQTIRRKYANISVSSPSSPPIIDEYTEIDSLDKMLFAPLQSIANLDMFTTWETVNPKLTCTPKEFPKATIHVRLLSLKAWMDGDVVSVIQNDGDVKMDNTKNDQAKYLETVSSKKKILTENQSKVIGGLDKKAKSEWGIGWKVEGIWEIFQALIDFITKGKMKVNYTCHAGADYTVQGKIFGIIPTSKTESYSKNYDVKGEVTVRKFLTDIQL